MTLKTALIINGNSAEAQRALTELDGAMERATQSSNELEQSMVRQRARGREMVVSAGAQRAGMQQLSYQIGDVAQQYALGISPMTIFAQQSGQVVQAIGMMRGSAGGLIGFLSGPWGVGISAAAVVLAPLIGKLFEAEEKFDDLGDAAESAMERVRRSISATTDITSAADDAVKRRINAMGELARANREAAQAEAQMESLVRIPGGAQMVDGYRARLVDASRRRSAAEQAIRAADADLAELRTYEPVRGMQERNRDRATGRSHRSESAGAIRSRTAALSDEEKARQAATEATDRYIAGLEDEIAKVGLDAKGLRELEAARQLEAAQTEDQKNRIADLNAERERELELEEARKRASAIGEENKGIAGSVAELEREAQVLGLVGWERERALLRLEREAEIRPLLTQLLEAEANGQSDVAQALREQIALLDTKYGIQMQIGDEAERLEEEGAIARELAVSYYQLGRAGVSALSDIALRGENAADVMQRLALSIADAALEAALLGTGPLANVFGGGGEAGGGGGLIGSLFGSIFGGGRADGGPVSPGKMYAVNERSTAPGLFFPLSPGRIEPPTNDNPGAAAPTVIELRVRSGEMFTATVEQISGSVAVRTVQEAAPSIVEVAAAETGRRLTRPRL